MTILYVGRTEQNDYIDEFETPPVVACFYYDEFGNFIHVSRISYTCPSMETMTKTNSLLNVQLYYEFPGEPPLTYTHQTDQIASRVEKGAGVVDIELHYDSNQNITEYIYQEYFQYIENYHSISNHMISSDVSYSLDKVTAGKFLIETTYTDEVISQTKTVYSISEATTSFDNYKDLSLYDFSSTSPQSTSTYTITYEDSTDLSVQTVPFTITYTENTQSTNHTSYIEEKGRYLIYHLNTDTDKTEELAYNLHLVATTSYESQDQFEQLLYRFRTSEEDPIYFTSKTVRESTSNTIDYDTTLIRYSEYVILENENAYYKIYSQDFGYIIEQYGEDGTKDTDSVDVNMMELVQPFYGLNDTMIGITTPTNIIYQLEPALSVNPIITFFKNRYDD